MVNVNHYPSIAVDCLHSTANSTNITSFRQATTDECRFSRFAGVLLLTVSLASFVINVHSLTSSKNNQRLSRRDVGLVMGMFISSLCVILISVPSVVTQCFLCRRLCITLVCRIEGFNSFLNGCAAIYMLLALSLIRFSTTANSPMTIHFQSRIEKHSSFIVLLCFFMGGIWAVPPLLDRMSGYAPEGLGFHCGLDWFDRSLSGRVYFFLLFAGVFFIPILIVIYIYIYIQRTVRRLTYLQPSLSLELHPLNNVCPIRRHVSSALYDKETQRLLRLYEDRCFVRATGVSLLIYMVAWTPYSFVALAQVFGDQYSTHNPWIMTTCALLAKLSMILNPIIYTIILRTHDMNKLK